MSELQFILVLCWLTLLLVSYICVRRADSWPRSALRGLFHRNFEYQRTLWKIGLLCELLVTFLIVLSAPNTFALTAISTRMILMQPAVWLAVRKAIKRASSTDVRSADTDPMLYWYRGSWNLPQSK